MSENHPRRAVTQNRSQTAELHDTLSPSGGGSGVTTVGVLREDCRPRSLPYEGSNVGHWFEDLIEPETERPRSMSDPWGDLGPTLMRGDL